MKSISLSILTLLLFSCKKEMKEPFKLPPMDNSLIELGQQTFKTECASCHKMEFKSIGPDISNLVYTKGEEITNQKLNELHKNKGCYPKELSITDVRSILEYLRQYEVWFHEINGMK